MRKLFTSFPIGGEFHLTADDTHHLMRVLRAAAGDEVIVTDSRGASFHCKINGMDGKEAVLLPVARVEETDAAGPELILAAAVLKNDKFDWLVQKATELGVNRIIPIQMKYCVVKLNEKRRLERCKRWQKIALEAAKQCGRTDVPPVDDVHSLSELVRDYGERFIVVPYELETVPAQAAAVAARRADTVVCIGPEGGFAREEIEFLKTCERCMTVSLGRRILRAETAALTAAAVIMYERGFK